MRFYIRIWWMDKTVTDTEIQTEEAYRAWERVNRENPKIWKYERMHEYPKRIIGAEFGLKNPTWNHSEYF